MLVACGPWGTGPASHWPRPAWWFYYNDNEPAHCPASYREHEALVEIDSLAVFRGELPRRAMASVLEWAALRRTELRANWESARNGVPPLPIEPLDQEAGSRTMALVRTSSVKPSGEFQVELTLTTGQVVRRDLTPFLTRPLFHSIRLDALQFRQVRVEHGTLVWPGGADFCPDVVIWGGLPPAVADPFAA